MTVVNEHPDPMVRDPHVVEIADRCHVDPDHLRRFAAGGPQHGTGSCRRRRQVPAHRSAGERLTPEDEARAAGHSPATTEVAGRLHATLFGDPVHREAYEALEHTGGVVEACDLVSEPAAQLLHRLAVDAGNASVEDVLARVARLTASRAMNNLRRLAASADDPAMRQQYSASVVWLKSQSERLDERNTRDDALARPASLAGRARTPIRGVRIRVAGSLTG